MWEFIIFLNRFLTFLNSQNFQENCCGLVLNYLFIMFSFNFSSVVSTYSLLDTKIDTFWSYSEYICNVLQWLKFAIPIGYFNLSELKCHQERDNLLDFSISNPAHSCNPVTANRIGYPKAHIKFIIPLKLPREYVWVSLNWE